MKTLAEFFRFIAAFFEAPAVSARAPTVAAVPRASAAPTAAPSAGSSAKLPLGIRNNNPGNLRPGSDWQGLADPPVYKNYLVFKTPIYGLRAMTINLRNQQRKHGLRTVRAIITKYAPSFENNTEAYIAAASKALGVLPDQQIDLENSATLGRFVRAIITHENGRGPWYAESVIQQGIEAAGK